LAPEARKPATPAVSNFQQESASLFLAHESFSSSSSQGLEFIMFSIVLASMMAMQQPAILSRARDQFGACLSNHLRSSLKAKMKPEDFSASIASACTAQETAFRKALIDVDLAKGIKRPSAEGFAGEQIEDYQYRTKDTFQMYHEEGAVPD
jgi:hypothetical protein